MGHAQGAQCVEKLFLEPRWFGAHGFDAADLRGAIGISGAYDHARQAHDLRTRPIPAMLLIAGLNDDADPEATGRLASTLRSMGGQVAEIRYPKLCDRGPLRRLADPIRFRTMLLGEIERFVRQHSLGSGA
jgi:hypothetical protein